MSLFDGNPPEMPEHRPVDDGAIEAVLAGTSRDSDLDPLSEFVSAVRSVVEVVPTPSTAMAAVLTAGLSTVKGDLSATAASNVNGPASQEAGLPKWRKALMKIQGFLAGLGVAGKVALGVGVAAAATTGAGAAGVLPFTAHGNGHPHLHSVVVHTNTTTTHPVPARSHGRAISAATHHAEVVTSTTTGTTTPATTTPTTQYVPPLTPTTVDSTPAPTTPTTPTTVTTPRTYETPTTLDAPTTSTSPTTTTTEAPRPQSIQLSCSATGATQITCTWTAAPSVGSYSLWRWTTPPQGNGSDYGSIFSSPDALTFVDNNVTPGVPFTYRVFTTLADGSQGPASNRVYMNPL